MKREKNHKLKKIGKWIDEHGDFFIAGIVVIMGAIFLIGIKAAKKENADTGQESNMLKAAKEESKNKLAEDEIKVEKELATYISEKTGQNIAFLNMTDVNLVESSGYYMVISGEMITNVTEGTKECSITLKLTKEQYETAQKFLERYDMSEVISNYFNSVSSADVAAIKYSLEFLNGIRSIIESEETEVVAVYDKDNKEWVFDAEEHVVSNKR